MSGFYSFFFFGIKTMINDIARDNPAITPLAIINELRSVSHHGVKVTILLVAEMPFIAQEQLT